MDTTNWVAWFLINQHSVFYAFGYNRYDIGPNFQTIHAECDAVNNLKKITNKNKKRVDVIIFRVGKSGDIMLGKPCVNCQKQLYIGLNQKGYSLNKVYYTENYTDKLSYIKKTELEY